VKAVTCEHILSRPQLIASFDLRMVNQKDIASVQHSFHFSSFGIAELQVAFNYLRVACCGFMQQMVNSLCLMSVSFLVS